MMAWNLACEMKRKKRSVPDIGGLVMGTETTTTMMPHAPADEDSNGLDLMPRREEAKEETDKTGRLIKRAAPEGYRPATLTEIMRICCDVGCEVRDLLAYCDPFGPWNS
jgi:hypothetical protein